MVCIYIYIYDSNTEIYVMQIIVRYHLATRYAQDFLVCFLLTDMTGGEFLGVHRLYVLRSYGFRNEQKKLKHSNEKARDGKKNKQTGER